MAKLYIIAGPNGSGKTTFAKEFLPNYAQCSNFINADLIAQGLSPFAPDSMNIKAGRLLLQQIDEFISRGEDFAIESTLSGKTYLSLFKQAKNKGYTIHIFFLWLSEVRLAQARIRERVRDGGHDVPDRDIKRRFRRSIANFVRVYKDLCESWIIFDNSTGRPVRLAQKDKNKVHIYNKEIVENILKEGA